MGKETVVQVRFALVPFALLILHEFILFLYKQLGSTPILSVFPFLLYLLNCQIVQRIYDANNYPSFIHTLLFTSFIYLQ